MESSTEYIRQMIDLLNQAKAEYNVYSKQLSRFDLETQDILHHIEHANFNAVQGYLLAKQLKDIRIKRRAVKQHQEMLQVLISNLKGVSFERIDKKLQNKRQQQLSSKYTPRVLAIPDRSNCM